MRAGLDLSLVSACDFGIAKRVPFVGIADSVRRDIAVVNVAQIFEKV